MRLFLKHEFTSEFMSAKSRDNTQAISLTTFFRNANASKEIKFDQGKTIEIQVQDLLLFAGIYLDDYAPSSQADRGIPAHGATGQNS